MSSRLEIRLLGRFEVLVDGRPVEIDSQPVQFLLAYLALHPNLEHRRDKLAGVLWPDSDEANARANLRHALWRLRQAIGDGFLEAETATIRLTPNAGVWVDASTIDQEALPGTSLDDRLAALSAYWGELLPGIYTEWVGLVRERLASVFQRRMQSALEELLQAARWTDAVRWAEHWISLGQVPEPAYRALMTAHAASNDSGAMALAYQRCVDALRSDLGVAPSQETEELYRRLASGERPERATAPREMGRSSSNLPAQTNTFIGREREIEAIQEMLARPDIRLLTLTGPGGTGKTRLATRVAARMLESFRDGAWFVDLAPLADSSRVASAIAAVLGSGSGVIRRFRRRSWRCSANGGCSSSWTTSSTLWRPRPWSTTSWPRRRR